MDAVCMKDARNGNGRMFLSNEEKGHDRAMWTEMDTTLETEMHTEGDEWDEVQ